MNDRNKRLNSILVKPAGPDCNMACRYCFYLEKAELFRDARTRRMGDAVLEAMIRQVMTQGGREVSFVWQGGEPTLAGLDFFEKAILLQQRHGRGQTVGNALQTNGIRLDEPWVRFLRKRDFLVGLSLDGPAFVHDHYRRLLSGRRSWSLVEGSAKRLLDAAVAVNALCVVTDHAARFPEEIYGCFKELGLTYMQFIPYLGMSGDALLEGAAFVPSQEDYAGFLCRLFDLWCADFREGVPTTSIRLFESLLHLYVGLDVPDCSLLPVCGQYLVVEHNGDVFSCDFYVEPKWRLGNVLADSLSEMLCGPRQEAFGCMKGELSAACGQCTWLNRCQGGCSAYRTSVEGGRSHFRFCEALKRFHQHSDAGFREIAKTWLCRTGPGGTESGDGQAPGRKRPDVGRNEPCPCGSGKKSKKCCYG